MDVPWQIIPTIVSAVVAIYTWTESRTRASREQLEAVRAAHEVRLDHIERAQSTIVERLAHLPTSTEFHRLEVAIVNLQGELRGSVASIRERIEATSQRADSAHTRIDRVENFLDAHSGAAS